MSFLYRYEAKGIQAYILQGDGLKEILGASAMIEGLGAHARELVKKSTGDLSPEVFAAAGMGMISFRDRAALEAFASVWPMEVAGLCPGLTMVTGWTEYRGKESMDAVRRQTDADRNRPRPAMPDVGPLVLRAGRSGLPATGWKKKEKVLMDSAAVLREKAASGEKDPLRERFGFEKTDELNSDLQSWGEGYVAVIHCDGNRIGKEMISASGDLKTLQSFSKGLQHATQEAAKRACRKVIGGVFKEMFGRDPRSDGSLPVRPIVLGGDDVTILMHAEGALPFVAEYLKAFEEETAKAEGLKKKLTACAGIAFVKSHFPFSQAHELAEALCKGAKGGLKYVTGNLDKDGKPEEATRSGLLFHRVTTSVLREWDDIRDIELAGALAGGPYSLDDLGSLLRVVRCIHEEGVGRGALRQWVSVLRDNPHTSRQSRPDAGWTRLALIAKERDPEGWKRFEDALRSLRAGDHGCRVPDKPKSVSASLSAEKPIPRVTPIYDALTLASLGYRGA